jgi:non-heme chloroperoxidase
MRSNQPMTTVRSDDGVAIAYTTFGDGPRTLLFLHGWGGASTGFFWTPILQELDLTSLRVILADLRGHGASEHASNGFTDAQFARDMFAVADHAGAEQVVLVAYSMSGRWAQWMACTTPDRVIGQMLIAAAPALDLPLTDDVKAYWLQVARDRTMATFDPWVHQFTRERLSPDLLQAYFEAVTTTQESSLGATLDMCRQQGSFVDRLPATRARTLVLGGRHDPMLPPAVLKQTIVDVIPGARLAVVDSGHEMPLERPRETAALLEAFLAGLR